MLRKYLVKHEKTCNSCYPHTYEDQNVKQPEKTENTDDKATLYACILESKLFINKVPTLQHIMLTFIHTNLCQRTLELNLITRKIKEKVDFKKTACSIKNLPIPMHLKHTLYTCYVFCPVHTGIEMLTQRKTQQTSRYSIHPTDDTKIIFNQIYKDYEIRYHRYHTRHRVALMDYTIRDNYPPQLPENFLQIKKSYINDYSVIEDKYKILKRRLPSMYQTLFCNSITCFSTY